MRFDPKWPLIEDLVTVAREEGVSVFKLAIDFVRSFSTVSTILIGLHSAAHLREISAMIAAQPVERDTLDHVTTVVSRWRGEHEQQ